MSLRAKFVRTSYHIIHNRDGMFYLTRTKQDCTSTQCICNTLTNRLPYALPYAKQLPKKTAKFSQLMSASPSSVEIQNCLQLNVSKCKISETEDRFVVTVYNPLSHNVSHFVRLPVQPGNYTVQDNNGKLRSQREKHVSLHDRYFGL